ncbi:MAG: ComEC/Rec2 family competence protein [Muribaculaceae bacterium]|nr:ComEC/Rec2 family competence protein [Muribaculaceae bacterium]
MEAQAVLSRIPVLRILVPFALGILLHQVWHSWLAPAILIITAIAFYITLNDLSQSPQGRLRWRSYFILPLAIAALALGWLSADIHCPAHLSEGQRANRVLTGRVIGVDYTDFSMRLTVDVLDNDLPRCYVLISTRGCDYTMQAGDLIAWQGELHEVGNMGNPDEMDYANYLLNNEGIRYQQHLPLGQIKKVGYSPTLSTRLANARRNVQTQVLNSQLSQGAQRFVVALLLGNSSLIDKTTRQEFSAAGIAHILALSGLHVGFIALIIWWLLFPLDYLRQKKLRLVITLVAIIGFALFTGGSPSVVRATVMIGFVFASLIFYRRSVSLNALAMAALAILLFSPSSLYSVGFQLSFVTVAALLVSARLPERFKSRYQWVNYLSTTIMASAVAMLATVALSAHYFHTISFLSVLSNLLILPVLPFFMVLGALFLLVNAAGFHWPMLDSMLDSLYRYIHWAAGSVNALPLSHMGGVYMSTFGVIAYFIVMALAVLWLYRRDHRYLLAAGLSLVVALGHSLWSDAQVPHQGLVVFNSFTSTPVLYYDNGTGYVWTPDEEETDSAAFARYHAHFLARRNINDLRFISNDTIMRLDGALIKPPYAHLMGHKFVAVGSGQWKHATASSHLDVDEIIVTKRYHGGAAKLQDLYKFDRLIISGAMHATTLTPLLRECDSLSIAIHPLSRLGAYCLESDK